MSKKIETFDELKTKAGYYPLFMAPLAACPLYGNFLDLFKDESGISLRSSKVTFGFTLAKGLQEGMPANELILVDMDYQEIFFNWITSYRISDTPKKRYMAIRKTQAPLVDPIKKAAGRILTVSELPVSLDILTLSTTEYVDDVITPINILPAPEYLVFKRKVPDVLLVQEANKHFNKIG